MIEDDLVADTVMNPQRPWIVANVGTFWAFPWSRFWKIGIKLIGKVSVGKMGVEIPIEVKYYIQ